ncbi:MAG TPA: hypothetical protein VEU77_12240 [Candidatus Acidoferrales bacterium]|nr:hypothetical protein [Candidatus Acidoferrales bacterium]
MTNDLWLGSYVAMTASLVSLRTTASRSSRTKPNRSSRTLAVAEGDAVRDADAMAGDVNVADGVGAVLTA